MGTEDFLGILIRVQAADGVNTTNVLLEGNELLEPAAACAAPIVGITHSSRTPKNNAIVILTIPGPGLVTLDVTVVFANVAAESIYYYTGFNLEGTLHIMLLLVLRSKDIALSLVFSLYPTHILPLFTSQPL